MWRLALLVIVLLAASACGDDEADQSTSQGPSSSDTSQAPTSSEPLQLTADVPGEVPAGPHTWRLELTNNGDDPITLTFPSAQLAEATLERNGEEAHRWSEGRFFTQQIVDVTLEPGASRTIELEDDLSAVAPGDYELTLELVDDHAVEPVNGRVSVVPPGS